MRWPRSGILAGVPASRLLPHDSQARDLLIVAATETATDEDCDAYAKALAEVLHDDEQSGTPDRRGRRTRQRACRRSPAIAASITKRR